MTRKDFEKLAKIVRDHGCNQQLLDDLIATCEMQNPRFDRARFLRACGVTGEKVTA